jgi:hypothetical protein
MNKKFLTSKKSQSMVEFVLVFPFFIIFALGIVQLAIIFMNAFMLQYTAYMVARVAVVYEEEQRMDKAETALGILKLMTYYANSISESNDIKNKAKDIINDAAIDYGASFINNTFNEKNKSLLIENINIEETQNQNEEKFIKVTVTQNLALKVPFVNKIFGLFNTDFRMDLPSIITDLLTLKIFDYDFSEITKVVLNEKFPYYTLKASAIMRVE